MDLRLKDATVLVTGGSRGIGLAIAIGVRGEGRAGRHPRPGRRSFGSGGRVPSPLAGAMTGQAMAVDGGIAPGVQS
jgi:hypothetical protein